MPRSYLEFHGLAEPPFSLTSDPRFIYETRAYSIALADVTNAVERREGLVVITGGPGMGKTLLCRALVQHLGPGTQLSAIPSPLVSGGELLSQIVGDLGLVFTGDLNACFAALVSRGSHAVVIIDEAQHLGKGALEEIQRLSRLEGKGAKLLPIILVGQPELRAMMERDAPGLAQLVALRCVLRPLAPDEVAPYIQRRLEVARRPLERPAPGDPFERPAPEGQAVAVSPEAVVAIARFSRGVPRTINLLGDRALALAAEREAKTIGTGEVIAAAGQLQLSRDEPDMAESRRLTPMVIAAAALAAVAVLTWWWVSGSRTPPAGPALAPATAAVAAPAVASPPSPPSPPTPQTAPAAAAPPVLPPFVGTLPVVESVVLSVGSYRSEEQANETMKGLEAKGLPVFSRVEGRDVRVVLVGPFVSREEALEANKKLEELRYRNARIIVEPPSRR